MCGLLYNEHYQYFDYTASKVRLVNSELEKTWKKAVMALLRTTPEFVWWAVGNQRETSHRIAGIPAKTWTEEYKKNSKAIPVIGLGGL
jgi:hypothetical protein